MEHLYEQGSTKRLKQQGLCLTGTTSIPGILPSTAQGHITPIALMGLRSTSFVDPQDST